MIRKLLIVIINTVCPVLWRYDKSVIAHKSTRFMRNFNITNAKKNRVVVGKDCLIDLGIIFEGEGCEVIIGDRVYIGNSKIICRNKVVFEDNILVSWGVTFYDHNSHSLNHLDRRIDIQSAVNGYRLSKMKFLKNKDWSTVKSGEIVVKKDSWIGMDALILKGVTIGEGSIVAARSVVSKDVPPFTVVAGNPAKVVRHLKNESNELA